MNTELLFHLDRLSRADLKTIREQHNELFTQLQQKVATARHTVGSPQLQSAIQPIHVAWRMGGEWLHAAGRKFLYNITDREGLIVGAAAWHQGFLRVAAV